MRLLEILKIVKYTNCPYCKKKIRKSALRCRWCGRWLNVEKGIDANGKQKYDN